MTAQEQVEELQKDVEKLKENLGYAVSAGELTSLSLREIIQRIEACEKLIRVLVELTDALTRKLVSDG